MKDKIGMEDSENFRRMFREIRQFFDKGLKLDKNPPKDVLEFHKMLEELETAHNKVKSSDDFTKFFLENSDDIDIILEFCAGMALATDKKRVSLRNG